MEPEDIEGVDPQELEEQASAVEELIAAALAAAAAAALAQMLIPGVPVVDIDGLSVIPTVWMEWLDGKIMPEMSTIVFQVSTRLRNEIADALPDNIPVPPVQDVTAGQLMAQARNRLSGIGDLLWFNTRTSLAQGLDRGETIPQLTERVRAAVGVTERRARTIARTEVISASNAASIAQARSAGVPMNKIWQSTEDARTRVAHFEADGQQVPLDSLFEVGGELLDFPGDPRGRADNVINCRCAIRYRILSATPVTAGGAPGQDPALCTCMDHGPNHGKPGPCPGWKALLPAGDPRRARDRERRAERAVEKMAGPRRPRKDRVSAVPVVSAEDRAQQRQVKIDAARARASVLAEVEERLMNGESPEILARTSVARARREGVADDPVIAEVLAATAAGDPDAIREAVRRAAGQLGFNRIGAPQEPFDPRRHQPIGDRPANGALVDLVRPGYMATIDGEDVLLAKADVEASIIPAAAPARPRAPARKAAPGSGAQRQKEQAARLGSTDSAVQRTFRGGALNDGVELLRLPDGSNAFRKKIRKVEAGEVFEEAIPVKDQMDAEELASLVAAEFGLKAPAVHRESDSSLIMEYMDGDLALSAPDEIKREAQEANPDEWARVGLFDTIIDNKDRHGGNWLLGGDGRPQLIDHALAFGYADAPENAPRIHGNDFSRNVLNQEWTGDTFIPNRFTPQDMTELGRRLRALKPEFERLGRGQWLTLALRRLKAMRPYAQGTENLIS